MADQPQENFERPVETEGPKAAPAETKLPKDVEAALNQDETGETASARLDENARSKAKTGIIDPAIRRLENPPQ